ncbi:MAG TPA: anthrone oxygenase family protein [Propionibacteriaceae bacterium]|nr:anthrone oxygenase family protein [Propionibacteriaceae bacterium]
MSDVLREAVLIAATLTTGLMAGVFGIYSNAIMPGLRRTDDRTFVAAFQSIDRAIINPAFMATFLGALVLTALSALLHLTGEARSLLPWTVAALLLYLVVFVVTIRVNVPRNNEIKAAGDVDRMTDVHGVRERFNEVRWVRWNHLRAFASILAFGLLCWALIQSGQAR